MKKLTAVIVTLLAVKAALLAQQPFEVFAERPNEKTFKGILTREVIAADTAMVKWWKPNAAAYTPDATAKELLTKYKDSVQLLVFMGTWCEDSQFIIPKLFALADATGFSTDHITLIGVDRQKKTLSNLSEALNVTNVPTIIVYKKGKELGRVVEYGKYGIFDKELGEILRQLN